VIDAHVHVFGEDSGTGVPPSFTPADLFAHAKPLGVRRVVLIQLGAYRFDNSHMLAAIRAHKGVFSGVAVVDHSRDDIERAVDNLRAQGVRGFRIAARPDPATWLDSPGMRRLWSYAAKVGMAMCPLVNPNALPAIDRMCGSHPDTTVVIDHMARIGASGEIRDSDIRLLSALAKHRNVHVKVSAFYALGRKQAPYTDLVPLIRRLVEDFGPRRLMWASDSPFQVVNGHTYAASVELVRDRLPFLSADDRAWLLERTAERVYFQGI
jgi:predicted TIM-barrel fold metal-dependent hydrolase